NVIGPAGADPAGDRTDAQGPGYGDSVVSIAPSFGGPARRPRYRMRGIFTEAASAMLGVVLLVWSLLPVYNMLLIALDPEGDNEFAGYVWPPDPSLESFWVVVTQGYWYLENFWSQFGNSLYIGVATAFLTMLIGSLASFAVGRMHLRKARLLTNAALLTYVLPSSFLAIPFLTVAKSSGLSDNLWGVIAAPVMVPTPSPILIL